MMKKMRNSVLRNQITANTTQDSAGTPCRNVNGGDSNRARIAARPITPASRPPSRKAPASPARVRSTVESTSRKLDQSSRIATVRAATSGTGGAI